MISRLAVGIGMLALLLCPRSPAQEQTPAPPSMNMSGHDMSDMPGMNSAGAAPAVKAMQDRHMDMGPHMHMTALRDPQPGDAQRAAQLVSSARKFAEQYMDYKVALANGFRIFLPAVPQKMYHFTNAWYSYEAILHFDPDHPSSLLYEKHGDGYKLVGVMYTAPINATEGELDQRVPLSVAQWHAHVNLCVPPAGQRSEMFAPHRQFGLQGSITTEAACTAAGGHFLPHIFGWMVHIYPFEKNPEDIWSVERQAHAHSSPD